MQNRKPEAAHELLPVSCFVQRCARMGDVFYCFAVRIRCQKMPWYAGGIPLARFVICLTYVFSEKRK